MRLIIATMVFAVTISIVWLVSAPKKSTVNTSQPETANIFLSGAGGQEEASATVTPATPTPTIVPTTSPTSTPQITISLTPTATPQITLTPSTTPTPTPTPTSISTPTPTPSSAISIVSLTSPVKQKDDATLVIAIAPGKECSIKVTWPSGTVSTSNDLVPKLANAEGKITWIWGVNWNTKPGTATIDLTCGNDTKTLTMEVVVS